MIRKSLILIFVIVSFHGIAQQYPWWSQYRNNQTLYNPAFCGTKRLIDIRINYRNQWTSFEGAPKTYALSLNSRLWKGRVGVGGFIFKDDIGPFRNLNSSLTAAYHLKFADSELSFGVQGNYLRTSFVGNDITLRHQQDKAINQYATDKTGTFDGSFGLLYYNDRFHLGVGANNMAGSKFEFYKNDSLKKGKFTNVPHYNISAGFNELFIRVSGDTEENRCIEHHIRHQTLIMEKKKIVHVSISIFKFLGKNQLKIKMWTGL